MKFLARLAFKLINMIISFAFICYAGILFVGMLSGKMAISSFLQCAILLFVLYKFFRSRFFQSRLWKLITREPVQNMQRTAARGIRIFHENLMKSPPPQTSFDDSSWQRANAAKKAAFHEYQARQNAGTYSGYQHQNLANKYRNDAK